MKKIYLLSLSFFIITLIILFVLYNRYSSFYEDELTNSYISKNIDILNENLNSEKRYAMSLSLLISQNQNIRKSLLINNQNLALLEMDKILKHIKKSTNIQNIDIQMHTKDLKAFARSWDKSKYFGTQLSSFRKGLVKVKKTQTSFVSIELGKRINIKAISPIFDNEHNFIGSIEVIMNFKNIKNRLEKFNLKMLALLDEKFIKIAVDLKDNPKIGKYYIVEKDYSLSLFSKLNNNTEILDGNKFYSVVEDKIIVLVPMRSIGIEDIGSIALSMNIKQDEVYSYSYENKIYENELYIFDKNKKREVIIK